MSNTIVKLSFYSGDDLDEVRYYHLPSETADELHQFREGATASPALWKLLQKFLPDFSRAIDKTENAFDQITPEIREHICGLLIEQIGDVITITATRKFTVLLK